MLIGMGFANPLTLRTMKKTSSLETLSTRLDELFALVETLLQENQTLRSELAQAELRNTSAEKRLAAARARIETLISRLPENDSTGLLP